MKIANLILATLIVGCLSVAFAGTDTGLGVIELSGNGDTATLAKTTWIGQPPVVKLIRTNTLSTSKSLILRKESLTGTPLFVGVTDKDDNGDAFASGTTQTTSWATNFELGTQGIYLNTDDTSGSVYLYYEKRSND